MFSKEELSLIMSALISKSIGIKYTISEKDYVCEEELNSLTSQTERIDKLALKVSKLLD
jgi:hypothetical protein